MAMLGPQMCLVGVLVVTLILAAVSNKRLRDNLGQANQSLSLANKTRIDLATCRKILVTQKDVLLKRDSEKLEISNTINKQKREIHSLSEQVQKAKTKDEEIKSLKAKLEKAAKEETLLLKKVGEAEKALDLLAKAEEARKAKEIKDEQEKNKVNPAVAPAKKA